MMMRLYYITILMALALSVSCARVGDDVVVGDVGEVVGVDVRFEVASQAELGAREPGRSITNPGVETDEGTAADYAPLDVWMIQYNGITDDALMVGLPRYVEISGSTNIQAVTSSRANTLVFIANTHDSNLEWGDIATLGQLKLTGQTITEQGDCVGNNLHPIKDLIMSGKYEGLISTGPITVVLKRNIVRLDLTLKNGLTSGLTLHSVELCNVPRRLCYTSGFGPRGAVFPLGFDFFDYPAELINASNSGPGGSQSFTFYLPPNERGVVTASTSGSLKSTLAPSYSSYLKIEARDASNQAFVYKIYPGANITNDYNLLSNGRYSLVLSINAPGDALSDGRVDDYGPVDFPSANTYILNPSPPGAKDRVFTIPIDRVNEFWQAQDPTLTIGPTDAWTAELIWQDTPTTDFIRFVDPNDGTLSTSFSGTGPAQRIAVTTKATYRGNALIGLRKTSHQGVGLLWSWQLWVTDYDPEYNVPPVKGQYVYSVPGGQVHRYSGTQWTNENGRFVDKYTMDRNLGALDATYNTAGAYYYQFGRKDPFLCVGHGNELYDIQGNKLLANNPYNSLTMNQNVGPVSIATGVLNPTFFYRNETFQDWTTEGKLAGYQWNGQLPGTEHKSLYDPCPHGWKVPDRDIYSDFVFSETNPMGSTTLSVARDQRLGWLYRDVRGVRYWPAGKEVLGEIYFSPLGIRYAQTGTMSSVSAALYQWTSTATDATTARLLYCQNFYIANTTTHRGRGLPLRCVQE